LVEKTNPAQMHFIVASSGIGSEQHKCTCICRVASSCSEFFIRELYIYK